MDLHLLAKALILGIIEGISEFLPISSTGYLLLARDLLDFWTVEKADLFIVVIQCGAILAVIFAYFERLFFQLVLFIFGDRSAKILATLPRFQTLFAQTAHKRRFGLSLIIATLPILLLGFGISDMVKTALFHAPIVATMLIVGGVVILVLENNPPLITTHTCEHITLKQALLIGLCQALAVIPGTSRAGASIIGALVCGLSRKAATEFSFFLGIPVLLGATTLDFAKNYHILTAYQDYALILWGIIISFITAFIGIKALITYVSNWDFRIFAYLRIITGILVLLGFIN